VAGSEEGTKHWGVVAVLDALGSSEPRNDGDWLASLARRKSVLGDLKLYPPSARHGFFSLDPAESGKEMPSFDVKSETFGFSDTVVFVFDATPMPASPGLVIRAVWRQIADWYVRAVLKGELYRGSISLGEFFRDGDLIMGPAINDAGRDYDKADWAGIVLTQRAGAVMTEPEVHEHPFAYVPWDVPLHPRWGFAAKEPRWTICWPTRCQVVQSDLSPSEFWTKVDAVFAKTKNASVKRKRRNTKRYFDEMWRRGMEARAETQEFLARHPLGQPGGRSSS
jgi:hypothetical protein